MIRWNMRAGILFALLVFCAFGAPLKDAGLQKYFEGEVRRIEAESFRGIESKADWEREQPRLKRELREMLGLEPLPERGDLRAQVTGKVVRDGIVVEKVHFQSSPGLYVTGNLYRPEKLTERLPAILYLCGHGQVKSNGVSYGNKVAYQHHGAWFARNGYVCLTIDTIQLGEIEGLHHGTHREGMWWWNSRGYTPAGVEAWNSMRALDYLEARPEVDKTRMGVTGRSGGGAYSWWIAALDERVKVAAPVAGITDLRDHVVDGVVEGHCDCMYFVNTYGWDYPMVAALVVPRPLLIGNSDKDTIFPLDGVVRTHSAAATVYRWLGAETNLGLLITEGPHKDTQDLQVPVFRWFNRHLKGEDSLIEMAATKLFTPEELKVFEKIPEDEITSKTHETFVPSSKRNGEMTKDKLRELLLGKTFAGWPRKPVPLRIERKQFSSEWDEVGFDSQEHVRLKMYVKRTAGTPQELELLVRSMEPDTAEPRDSGANAVLVVRGGVEADTNTRTAVQTRRRYMMVGQTLDGMRVWDILRGVELLKNVSGKSARIALRGEGKQAANLLMAAVMSTEPIRVANPVAPSEKESDTPDYLNFLKVTTWEELRSLVANSESK